MGDMSREPSMEEILSSIRQVIARDEGRREAFAAALDADDVLTLTQDNVEHASDAAVFGVDVEGEDMPAAPSRSGRAAKRATVEQQPAPEDTLLSQVSAVASRHSLDALAAALAEQSAPQVEPSLPTSGDVTVNAMVEAMLRPMLRDWLDSNLPPIVERLVAREINRIVGDRA